MNKGVVIFGAGAVGRGFIGEIFADAGWAVTFVEAAADLVAALQRGHYPHDTVANSATSRKFVEGCAAIPAADTKAVAEAVAVSDVVFTCVGARNLPRIVPALALGLSRRGELQRDAIDVFLAENIPNGPDLLSRLLTDQLAELGADPMTALNQVGVVETSIGRMIPLQTDAQRQEHPALVSAEPYRELPFDASACRAPVPDVPDLVSNQEVSFGFYTSRKLHIHNQGHCLAAYLGMREGYAEIAQAIADVRIRKRVQAAMNAAALALAAKYSQPEAILLAHVEDLIERFENAALRDTVERVGRDPERKLAPGERFLGALQLTAEHGAPEPVLPGVVLALQQLRSESPKSYATTRADVRGELQRLAPRLLAYFDEQLDN